MSKQTEEFTHEQLRVMLGEIASIAAQINLLGVKVVQEFSGEQEEASILTCSMLTLTNVIGGIADMGEGMAQRGDLLEWVLPPSFKPSEATT